MADRLAFLDVDGVLADTRHRDQYAIQRDWGVYFDLADRDGVWPQGHDLIERVIMCGWDFAYLTGRREAMRPLTMRWFREHGFPTDVELIMRRDDDRQKLAHLKAGVIADALLLYPDGVVLWDDDPWVIDEANKVRPGAGRLTDWYVKPQSIVRKASG